jgi:hypothetical protein
MASQPQGRMSAILEQQGIPADVEVINAGDADGSSAPPPWRG